MVQSNLLPVSSALTSTVEGSRFLGKAGTCVRQCGIISRRQYLSLCILLVWSASCLNTWHYWPRQIVWASVTEHSNIRA
jgi:hypothetical protein